MERPKRAKLYADMLKELGEGYNDLSKTMLTVVNEVKTTKQLWRSRKQSTLVKIGLALLAFPDPTISDLLGTIILALSMLQKGIEHRTPHIDDLHKAFRIAFKELEMHRKKLDL